MKRIILLLLLPISLIGCMAGIKLYAGIQFEKFTSGHLNLEKTDRQQGTD